MCMKSLSNTINDKVGRGRSQASPSIGAVDNLQVQRGTRVSLVDNKSSSGTSWLDSVRHSCHAGQGGTCRQAGKEGVRLIVFPEALLGGYPKGVDFGARVGSRSDAGRDLFRRYWDSAIVCPGQETAQIAEWTDELGLHIVIGIIERDQ